MKRSPELAHAAAIVEQRLRDKRRSKRIMHRRDTLMTSALVTRSDSATAKIVQSFGANAMNLYNCKSVSDGYRITKFTRDYEIESSYIVSAEGCDCPAGARPVCRHRTMLPFFVEGNHVDDGWFFIWDTRQWLKPVGEAEGVAEQNERWTNGPEILSPSVNNDVIRPQGAPSTSNQPTNEFVEFVTQANNIADEIEQADPGSATDALAQPAPPTEPTPIAPQTESASAEGAGFKFRRPKL
jgi:hypothetical protein